MSKTVFGNKIAYYEARERETERRATPSYSQSEQDGHNGTTR
ncbi:hypothetical protein BSLA_01f2982 [Burkholderia stabilis]|nr:hypothetical protein BSLA_01f2982 [Burkholderia stabilis]